MAPKKKPRTKQEKKKPSEKTTTSKRALKDELRTVGVEDAEVAFKDCSNLADEFSVIKKVLAPSRPHTPRRPSTLLTARPLG